jgi:hypothetical protein
LTCPTRFDPCPEDDDDEDDDVDEGAGADVADVAIFNRFWPNPLP